MSIKIEDVQRLLLCAPSKGTAEALKEWRAQWLTPDRRPPSALVPT